MKRATAFVLALALMLTLSSALAADTAQFSDVPANAWYAPYVEVCVDAGLMQGTGGGQFSPQLYLSQPECMTLALRLYDLNHGGDGVLPQAPTDWSLGSFSLTFGDDTELFAYVSDPKAVNFQPTGLIFYIDATRMDWAKQQNGSTATLSYQGETYSAALQFRLWDGMPELIFPVSYGTPFYPVYDTLTNRRSQVPSPNAWYRDAWYYLEQHELGDRFYFSFESDAMASREQFCRALFHAAEPFPALNELDGLPDTADSDILALYGAGILTGQDQYGTFAPESALTRAEAAALCARVLRPELRVAFTTAPLPEVGYTLTWLADGEPNMGTPNTCLCDVNGDYFITPEGKRIDWPAGHVPSFSFYHYLDCLMIGTYLDTVRDLKVGIMAGDGSYVVPLRTYDSAYPTGDGHFVVGQGEDWLLLDSGGALLLKLPALSYEEGTWQDFNEGLVPRMDPDSGLYGYADAAGNWVLAPRWRAAQRFSSGYAKVAGEDYRYGIIDHGGKTVIPTVYQELGLFQNSPDYDGGGYFSYTDAQGQNGWLSPDGAAHPGAPGTHSGSFANGYALIQDNDGRTYYLGMNLKPASQKFDWAGPVGADGRGFVGLDGKIYRIEFSLEF